MARASSTKVGQGPCPSKGCEALVWFRKSAGGMLSHRCDTCDSSGYAEPGGKSYGQRMASMTIKLVYDAPPAPAPAPAPAPKAPKGKAPSSPPNSVFSLAQL